MREIPDAGCLLVRPDAHIAYRAFDQPDDPTGTLWQTVSGLLGR